MNYKKERVTNIAKDAGRGEPFKRFPRARVIYREVFPPRPFAVLALLPALDSGQRIRLWSDLRGLGPGATRELHAVHRSLQIFRLQPASALYVFGLFCARMAELADALDSKSSSERSVGSTPTLGTKQYDSSPPGGYMAKITIEAGSRLRCPISRGGDDGIFGWVTFGVFSL